MASANARSKAREADVLISPALGKVGMMDFSQKKFCMQAGIEATRTAMPAIRDGIATWKKSKGKGSNPAA